MKLSLSRCLVPVLVFLLSDGPLSQISLANPTQSTDPAVSPPSVVATVAAPTIADIHPRVVTAGGPDVTININGTNFGPSSQFTCGGQRVMVSSVSAGTATVVIPAGLTVKPGTLAIRVSNGPGIVAAPAELVVTGSTNLDVFPTLTGISPQTVVSGTPDLKISIAGNGFIAGTTVTASGTALRDIVVSATAIMAVLPAALVAKPGKLDIVISNGPGIDSEGVDFTVTAPPAANPVNVTPSIIIAGGSDVTIAVEGSGFQQTSHVYFGRQLLPTTFVSASRLTAVVPAALVSQPVAANIVVTEDPVTSSAAFPFTVSAGASPEPVTIAAPSKEPATTEPPVATSPSRPPALITEPAARPSTSPTIQEPPSGLTPAPAPPTVKPPGSMSSPTATGALAGLSPATVPPATVPAGMPGITTMAPNNAPYGASDMTMTVNGNNFIPSSEVLCDGRKLQTSYVTSGQVTAVIPSDLLARPGALGVSVSNGSAPTDTCPPVPFRVTGTIPIPQITSITPESITEGGRDTSVTILGNNFIQPSPGMPATVATTPLSSESTALTSLGLTVLSGDTPLETSYVSSSELTAIIPAAMAGTPRTLLLRVFGGPAAPVFSAPAALTIVPASVPPPPSAMVTYTVGPQPTGAKTAPAGGSISVSLKATSPTTIDLKQPVSVVVSSVASTGTGSMNSAPVFSLNGVILSPPKPAPAQNTGGGIYTYQGTNGFAAMYAGANDTYSIAVYATSIDFTGVDTSSPVRITVNVGGHVFQATATPTVSH